MSKVKIHNSGINASCQPIIWHFRTLLFDLVGGVFLTQYKIHEG